jgi:hypothetical protein
MVHQAYCKGIRRVVLPLENAQEARLVGDMQLCVLSTLRGLADPLGWNSDACLSHDRTTVSAFGESRIKTTIYPYCLMEIMKWQAPRNRVRIHYLS